MGSWVNGRSLIHYSNSIRRICRTYSRLISTRRDGIAATFNIKRTEVDYKLQESREPMDVLASVTEKMKHDKIEPNEALTALKLQRDNVNILKDNDSFKALCGVIGNDCPTYSTNILLSCLKTVLSMNFPPDMYMVQSLQTEVLWKMTKMRYKKLIFLLSFHSDYKRNEVECKVVEKVIEMIEKRWVELDSLKDASNLIALKGHFSKSFMSKLEIRTIELVESAAIEDICRLFVSLSDLKYRPIPLLRSLSFHLTKEKKKLNVDQATDVLCAMNSLKFPDHVLLGRLSEDLILEIDKVEKASTIAAILTNLGQIKWKNTVLIDCLSQWITKNMNKCQPQHLASYVITVANLNYLPPSMTIFDKILAELTEKSISRPEVWLDVVHSLVIINKAKVIHLVSVLNPAFSEKIINPYGKIKLATVSSFAKFEHPNYKQAVTFSDVEVARPKVIAQNNSEVLNMLYNFVPKDRFMKSNKMVLNCLPIEAEFVIDSKGKPLPLGEYASILDKNEPLPSGIFKVALVVRHYKDYLIGSQELTGGNSLANKLLEKLNYLVVVVPYSEYTMSDTTLKKVQYLQNLILKSIADKQKSL